MFTPFARFICCAVALVGTIAVSTARAETAAAPQVRDYDVFVDLPTAFAFIKLPTGWKFIGKLDAEQLRQLPPGTITSLLPADDDAQTRVAGRSSAPAEEAGSL